jgi:hypothetical protein
VPESRAEDAWLPLRETRAELIRALEGISSGDGAGQEAHGEFPRSWLFRSVMQHHRGTMLAVGIVLALALANPRLTARLVRRVPVGLLVARILPLLR